MHVISVIDVKGGVAVAARGGNRAAYQPIATPLASGSDPLAIALGYRSLYPFDLVYVADLDGIERSAANLALVRDLASAMPEVALWVDNGASDEKRVGDLIAIERVCAVVGSENGMGAGDVARLTAVFPSRIVLSLDFKGDAFLGNPELLSIPEAWPDQIIVMTLARVGANEGPDLARLSEIVAAAGGRKVYAAGGIRNRADLDAAHRAGAAGALIATALHAGQITARDLGEVAKP